MDGSRAEQDKANLGREASEAELRAWVEDVAGAGISKWKPISGGNRCRSWAVTAEDGTKLYLRYQPPRPPSAEAYTVWREARFYQVLANTDVRAPRLIAVNDEVQAILTELAPGRADFRRIDDDQRKAAIADDFVSALAQLHAVPIAETGLADDRHATIAACVSEELAIWRAMYQESGERDPLIEMALDWLDANLPDPPEAPVLVHGDAGPGNFLFEGDRMTALLDWELAHVGDPMEDLAWFSMRAVMEPVPDFPARIRAYEAAAGRPVDTGRILYHRVFVSTRVVIIRHRNVTGEPGNSIVSRALNRRLLVDALAAATGTALPHRSPLMVDETALTPLYDSVVADLRHRIAEVSDDPAIVAASKNLAKVVKYLREADRLGPAMRAARTEAIEHLLAKVPGATVPLEAGSIPFDLLLEFFAGDVAREAQMAAPSSGGLATRDFPALKETDDD